MYFKSREVNIGPPREYDGQCAVARPAKLIGSARPTRAMSRPCWVRRPEPWHNTARGIARTVGMATGLIEDGIGMLTFYINENKVLK